MTRFKYLRLVSGHQRTLIADTDGTTTTVPSGTTTTLAPGETTTTLRPIGSWRFGVANPGSIELINTPPGTTQPPTPVTTRPPVVVPPLDSFTFGVYTTGINFMASYGGWIRNTLRLVPEGYMTDEGLHHYYSYNTGQMWIYNWTFVREYNLVNWNNNKNVGPASVTLGGNNTVVPVGTSIQITREEFENDILGVPRFMEIQGDTASARASVFRYRDYNPIYTRPEDDWANVPYVSFTKTAINPGFTYKSNRIINADTDPLPLIFTLGNTTTLSMMYAASVYNTNLDGVN